MARSIDWSYGLTLFDSYHCSRYNTQTRRLTEPMFEQVFDAIGLFFQGCRMPIVSFPGRRRARQPGPDTRSKRPDEK